jgi:hypothetical protein
MNFFRERPLSQAAADLVQFDADSIRQVASAQHSAAPDVWLADPDGYEKNGRVLRDNESARMLAYSTKDHILYATDGCNSCARKLNGSLEAVEANDIRIEFLQQLVSLVKESSQTRP